MKNDQIASTRPSRRSHDTNAHIVLMAELHTLSDRDIAIVGAAAIEYYLTDALKSDMIDLKRDDYNNIFGYDAPLGTFSAKINICFAFRKITAETRAELNIIKLIRNEFGHTMQKLDFDDPWIAERALSLGHFLRLLGYTDEMQNGADFESARAASSAGKPALKYYEDGSFDAAIHFPNLNTPRGRFIGSIRAFVLHFLLTRPAASQDKP